MRLGLVTLVVDDYDGAIESFVNVVAFDLVEDSPAESESGRPKRWVVVRPAGALTGSSWLQQRFQNRSSSDRAEKRVTRRPRWSLTLQALFVIRR